jgi:anti-sigma factor RsiW
MRHPETALVDYLRGELAADERERVGHHLANCPRCRREVQSYSAVLQMLARELEEEATPDWATYRAQLMRKLARRTPGDPTPRRRSPLLVWSSLAAGAAVATVLLLLNLHPRQELPSADQFAIEDSLAGADVGLLRDYPVIEHLDLIENYDVIEHLDELSPTVQPSNETRS